MQHDNLVPSSPHCLPLKERTLAQALQSAGYSTHAVGKWHLGYCLKDCLPTRRGFDSYLGMVLGNSNHFDYSRKDSTALFLNETPIKQVKRYSTFLYTERAEEIIRFHKGQSKVTQISNAVFKLCQTSYFYYTACIFDSVWILFVQQNGSFRANSPDGSAGSVSDFANFFLNNPLWVPSTHAKF